MKESVGRFHQEMNFKTLLMGEGSFVHLPYLLLVLYGQFVCIFLRLRYVFAEHQYYSPVYQSDWKDLWSTVAKIGEKIASCSDLWRNSDRDVAKKRALPDLLKSLEKCGLQKHKFENVEVRYLCFSISAYVPRRALFIDQLIFSDDLLL